MILSLITLKETQKYSQPEVSSSEIMPKIKMYKIFSHVLNVAIIFESRLIGGLESSNCTLGLNFLNYKDSLHLTVLETMWKKDFYCSKNISVGALMRNA